MSYSPHGISGISPKFSKRLFVLARRRILRAWLQIGIRNQPLLVQMKKCQATSHRTGSGCCSETSVYDGHESQCPTRGHLETIHVILDQCRLVTLQWITVPYIPARVDYRSLKCYRVLTIKQKGLYIRAFPCEPTNGTTFLGYSDLRLCMDLTTQRVEGLCCFDWNRRASSEWCILRPVSLVQEMFLLSFMRKQWKCGRHICTCLRLEGVWNSKRKRLCQRSLTMLSWRFCRTIT